MPMIDMTDLLSDPDFSDEVLVRRRTETVSEGGVSVVVDEELTMRGIVTVDGEPIVQDADYMHTQAVIEVHVPERLLDATTGHQPDIVVYGGQNFQVRKVSDFSRFGQGFCSAACEMVDLERAAP
jgi:hypothetical protein